MAKLINNYIIGLGGAGGSSVAAFKRALAMRSHEAKQMEKKGVRFAYLYIDSNETDIAKAQQAGGKWSVPGSDVHLESSECLQIDGKGFTMEHARMLGNISPWFGDTRNVNLLNLKQKIEGAGQRRRYGRMLLARKASELTGRLTVGKSNLVKGSTDVNSVTYHIFATLGGGTGSGSVVDLVTYLYHSSVSNSPLHPAEIYLYLYVGGGADEVKAAAVNTNSLFLNEYSALRDINALQTKGYRPEMAADPHDNMMFDPVAAPIKAIYLSSEDSEHRYSLQEQIEQMAGGCLDLISLFNSSGTTSENARPFSGEDLVDGQPGEVSIEDEWNSCGQKQPEKGENCQRSYHFQTLAISRCKEPVREVQTVLKSAMAQQVIERLLKGEVKNRETRNCTVEGNPVIFKKDMTVQGSRLAEAFAGYRDEILETFMEKYKPENVDFGPDTLRQINDEIVSVKEKICRDTYRDAQTGIVANEIQKMCIEEASILMSIISEKLKYKRVWASRQPNDPIWGIENIDEYLAELIKYLEHEFSSEFSFTASNGNLEKRREEWEKICGLTHLFHKRDNMYDVHYSEALAVLNRCFAEREQCIHRIVWKELCKSLVPLRDKVRALNEKLSAEESRQKRMEETYKKMLEVNRDTKGVVYIFEKEYLDKHLEFYRTSEADEHIAMIMTALEKDGGSTGAFLPLEKSLPDVFELDKNEGISFWSLSQEIHDKLISSLSTQYKPAYHKNIFDAIKERDSNEFGGDLQKLESYLKPMAGIDPSPIGGNGLTANFTLPPYQAVMVGAPMVDGDESYAKEIKQKLSAKFSSRASDVTRFWEYALNDQHELRVMFVAYWMPVRYFSFMRFLHKTYEEKPADVDMKTNLYYSNIDDWNEQKPLLVPENVSPLAHQARIYFELGKYLPVHVEEDSSYMVTQEVEQRDGSKIYKVHTLTDDKKKTLCRTIDYKTYTMPDMVHGNHQFVGHLSQAIRAWFLLEHAKPSDILEQLENCQKEAVRKEKNSEANFLSGVYNEFQKFIKSL